VSNAAPCRWRLFSKLLLFFSLGRVIVLSLRQGRHSVHTCWPRLRTSSGFSSTNEPRFLSILCSLCGVTGGLQLWSTILPLPSESAVPRHRPRFADFLYPVVQLHAPRTAFVPCGSFWSRSPSPGTTRGGLPASLRIIKNLASLSLPFLDDLRAQFSLILFPFLTSRTAVKAAARTTQPRVTREALNNKSRPSVLFFFRNHHPPAFSDVIILVSIVPSREGPVRRRAPRFESFYSPITRVPQPRVTKALFPPERNNPTLPGHSARCACSPTSADPP